MKKAILVHGWAGDPENNWFPWLKKELVNRGYEIVAPVLPESNHPKIEPWVKTLTEATGEVNEETIFIGHSIGCQTIFRFLETTSDLVKVKAVICVGGWFSLFDSDSEDPKERATAKPWLTRPMDFAKLKVKIAKIVAILSDNDQYVPFEENLGAEVYLIPGQWHFDDDYSIKEVPKILEFI